MLSKHKNPIQKLSKDKSPCIRRDLVPEELRADLSTFTLLKLKLAGELHTDVNRVWNNLLTLLKIKHFDKQRS